MPNRTIAGAVALLAAPIIVIAGTLAQPTLSDDAASQVAALTDHRGAMITSMALSSIAVVLLIAGIIWFALALAPRAPRLAMAGGVLGVFGLLAVLFENGVAAAFPAIAGGLDRIQAAFVLDRIHSARHHGARAAVDHRRYRPRPARARRRQGGGAPLGRRSDRRRRARRGSRLRDRHQSPGDHRVRGSFPWPAASRAHDCRVPRAPAGCRGRQGRSRLLSATGVPGCFALSSGDGRKGIGYRTPQTTDPRSPRPTGDRLMYLGPRRTAAGPGRGPPPYQCFAREPRCGAPATSVVPG